ncbi:MAG: DNA-binding response regulator [Gammaproteobacteria bacterium]|nr:MAG: DNA-binding response regulator [Gammaproteobacteria bacterium]
MYCLIVEDHPIYKEALEKILGEIFSDIVIRTASSLKALQDIVETEKDFDLILLDLTIPGIHGFSGVLYLRGQYPNTPVVVISAREEAAIIQEAISYGIKGYISKSADKQAIADTLNDVLSGKCSFPPNIDAETEIDESYRQMAQQISELTNKQFQVFTLLTEGLSNQEIANTLFVSLSTAKAHVSAVMKILGVKTRSHVAVIARKLQLEDDVDI